MVSENRKTKLRKQLIAIHLHFFFFFNPTPLDLEDGDETIPKKGIEERGRQKGNVYTKRNEFNRSFTVQVFEQSTTEGVPVEGGNSIRE